MRYAIIRSDAVVGVVNWDGEEEHPYGPVELVGPLPDGATWAEWQGRPRAEVEAVVPQRPSVTDVTAGDHNIPNSTMSADILNDASFASDDGPLVTGFMTPAGIDAAITNLAATHPLDHDGNGQPGGSLPAAPGAAVLTPQALLAAAGTMPFFTFRAEAQKILGADTPAGKAKIIQALKAKAEE